MNVGPIILTYDALKDTKFMISKRDEAGQIPPDFKKEFLERIIKEGKCICGTDISTHESCNKKLNELLKIAVIYQYKC